MVVVAVWNCVVLFDEVLHSVMLQIMLSVSSAI